MSRILPILFNTDMVQAILDGKKTVTRRICKDVNKYSILEISFYDPNFYDPDKRTYAVHSYADLEHTDKLSIAEYRCPICQGDILYVRETWAFQTCIDCDHWISGIDINDDDFCAAGNTPTIHEDRDSTSEGCYIYRADHPRPDRIIWRPSIHMPKAAARIWLEVTDVKIQRLQEMTLGDFLSEGVAIRPEAYNDPDNAYAQARYIFTNIWDSTLPKRDKDRYSWAANPWVWVYDFKRREKPEPCILEGIEPTEYKRPCIGYQKSPNNDEPCGMCEKCEVRQGEKLEI